MIMIIFKCILTTTFGAIVILTLYLAIPNFNENTPPPPPPHPPPPQGRETFENIVGIEENAGYQHFLLFPHCFLLFPKQISTFESY